MDTFGYFSTEELLILVWDVSQKFSEKKTYLGIFSQKQICVLPLLLQIEEGLWEVPVGGS